jgi:heme exporter protein D
MLDFDAGKYAPYVWTAYGLTAAIFVLMVTDTLARARRWRRKARQGEADKTP